VGTSINKSFHKQQRKKKKKIEENKESTSSYKRMEMRMVPLYEPPYKDNLILSKNPPNVKSPGRQKN